MDPIILVAASIILALGVCGAAFIATRGRAAIQPAAPASDELRGAIETLIRTQASVSGRLEQMTATQAQAQETISERLQSQERVLAGAVDSRLGEMLSRMDNGLGDASRRQNEAIGDLRERLASIDAAQKSIVELSSGVMSLQDVLVNKQARGAFGELQLEELVSDILPPSAYSLQAPMAGGKRVDCLIRLPEPAGSIAVDAKFPLESWHALRAAGTDAEKTAASRAFGLAISKHIRDISEKYIVPGETVESALMFLPSEAVYAEIHSSFPDIVEKSYRAKVWIVSPTTLMATLSTIRAVLRDARMREQADVVQKEVSLLLVDVQRLDERLEGLTKYFEQSSEALRQARISSGKISKRGERIEAVQVGDEAPSLD